MLLDHKLLWVCGQGVTFSPLPGFQAAIPLDNIILTAANKKSDQSLSDFQAVSNVAAHASLEREQLISCMRSAIVDTVT